MHTVDIQAGESLVSKITEVTASLCLRGLSNYFHQHYIFRLRLKKGFSLAARPGQKSNEKAMLQLNLHIELD